MNALASHLIIAPIAIPAFAAALLLLAMRQRRAVSAAISLASVAAMLAAALALLVQANGGTTIAYAVGDWPAPFGIELVADRLAAMMLVLAAALALIALLHAVLTRADRKGWHFHPLFQFQLMGLNGAFLTGDLFNLFVFFEVLLIASYGLMLHGQGAMRLRAGVQYVIVNLVGSALFLIALGLLYALTGTLNMADMAARVAALGTGDQALLRIAGLLLTLVFALKAAVVPLHLWLPGTYAAATPAVAALFAILTKVGVYALIRVVSLVFGEAAGAAAWVPQPWLLPAAIFTAIIGCAGVFAARGLRDQAAYAVIGSTGTVLIALAGWQAAGLAAALFYMVQSAIAAAALFLIADAIARRDALVAERAGEAVPGRALIALMFLLAAVAVAGLPPLPGFVGKLMILDALADQPGIGWTWGTILGTTLLAVLGLARAGMALFWERQEAAGPAPGPGPGPAPQPFAPGTGTTDLIAPGLALALLLALAIGAGPAAAYASAAAAQVLGAPPARAGLPMPSQRGA